MPPPWPRPSQTVVFASDPDARRSGIGPVRLDIYRVSPRFFTPPLLLRKSDADLAALVRAGHEAAFSAIVLRHRSHLLRYCRRMLRDHRAEDAVQQTFLRALQALRTGTEVRELGPWLCRIARNVALDEISAGNWNHAELNADWEDVAGLDEVERRARLRDALAAVDALPTRQRTALLRSLAGEPAGAIAQDLGLTSMAARQLLHRARVNVRAAVQALLPPPLLWLSRRLSSLSERVPRVAGAPAGAAPVAAKVAVAVVASAGIAAPVAVIHHALTRHPAPAHERRAAVPHPAPTVAAAAPPVIPALQPVVLRRALAVVTHSDPPPAAKPRRMTAPPSQPRQPRPSQPQPSQSPGVSASSPNSAPVGDSSSSPSAPSGAAVAADAGPSGASGAGSGPEGPMSSATASGPTGGADGGSSAAASGPSGG